MESFFRASTDPENFDIVTTLLSPLDSHLDPNILYYNRFKEELTLRH